MHNTIGEFNVKLLEVKRVFQKVSDGALEQEANEALLESCRDG